MNENNPVLDRHCIALLAELQRDARQTVAQLAEAVGLSATPCWKRIKEMEASGVIRGYSALVDRQKVGLNLAVVVECNLSQHSEDLVRRFEDAVRATPQIVRCLSTTGQSDYLLTVLVPDIQRGAITRKGREWSAPLESWRTAFQAVFDAVEAGVAYVPGAAFYADHADARTVRLSFVTLSPEQIEAAVALLGGVLRRHLER